MSVGTDGPGSPNFRPMDFGEIIDRSFKLFFRHWKPLVTVGLISAIPQVIYNGFINMINPTVSNPTSGLLYRVVSGPQRGDFSGVAMVLGMATLFGFVTLLLYPLVQGAVIAICSRTYLGQPTTAGMALRISARRYGALLGTVLLLTLLYIVAIPVLTVAGLLILAVLTIPAGMVALVVYTAFTNHAIVVENVGGGVPAIRRSFMLVGGRFWLLLGMGIVFMLMTGVLGGVVAFLIGLPLQLGRAFIDGPVGMMLGWISAVITAGVSAFTTPLTMIGLTLAYYDTRIRKEGFDLEMLAHSQATAPTEPQ